MKKVLVLNYEFPPLGGGASPVSYELAKRLSETGACDIDVVTMGFKGLPAYEEINPRMRVHRVKAWRRKKEICHPWEQLTYLVSGYFKCRNLLTNGAFDVCHCHFIIPTGTLAWFLKRRLKLSYVITAHGSDVPGFNTDRFTLLHKFTGPLLRMICRDAQTVISPSHYLRNLILGKISPALADKTVVVPNGIDTNKFTPQPKKKIIFSSGRLLRRKGFQYLIRAVSDEDIGYEVHIAGDGPMMGELQRLAALSKTKIIFHGWLDNNGREYKDLIEQAATYVLASERENASIALLEAMAAGCAVITSNRPGPRETIGTAGLVVDPRSSEQIRTALESASTRTAHYGLEARARLEQVFDWKRIIPIYETHIAGDERTVSLRS